MKLIAALLAVPLLALTATAAEPLPEGIKSAGTYGISVEHLTDAGIAFLNKEYGKRTDARIEFTNKAGLADFARLKELPWVRYVEMRGVITPEGQACLKDVKELRHLELNGSTEIDSNVFAALTKLEAIELGGVTVRDLSWVKQMPGLQQLSLHQCKGLTDLAPITGLATLIDLNVYGCQLNEESLKPVGTLANLRKLHVGNNPINSLAPISGCVRLEELDCTAARTLSDISVLTHFATLTYLDLSATPISDISVLKSCPLLQTLKLDGSKVANLSVLKSLSRLTYVRIPRTPVTDIAPLAGLTSLEFVDLENTSVTSIAALNNLRKLTTVRLPSTVPADAVARLKQNLPEASISQQKPK